ncbi:copper transporter [Actinoplanes sp. LDG1-06]|uniref:Copper transporter n=1 Tax=Paractinoplanes ovalisporus TaxID=2810368 RepID=A0ABS2AVA3_9ACTN|nr:copper transporter [Actinoplanes ovalisporus]MBM2623761.1 copper transporter [Actinoplanes ovalisporus]
MINFRYHVVSLTAVFLALAIGLVVGTAALNGPVADNLKSQITALNKDLSNKRDEINQYREEINRSQDFATEIAPTVLNGKLAGRKLAVLALPGTDQYADKVIQMLTIAGATITAKVTVQDKFFDPAVEFELLDLASESSQPTIGTADLPLNSNGVETASAQLAMALLSRTSPAGGAPVTQPSAGDVTAVLTAYTKASYIAVDDDAVGGAEATVMVTGAPAVDKDAAKKAQSLVYMAGEVSKNRPLVVAGVGVGEGNLISAVRGDPTLVKDISTVDNASTADGQVAAAMATIERVVDDKVGQYGLAAGAASFVPKASS